jgi:hypothetical protein
MARSSHLMQVARRVAVGVPMLAPPRALFPRWGTVAPLPELDSGTPAENDRIKTAAATRPSARPVKDSSKPEPTTQTASDAPRTAVQSQIPKAPASNIASAKTVVATDSVTPDRSPLDIRPDQPQVKVSPAAPGHPAKESVPVARHVDKAATPVARFSPATQNSTPAPAIVTSPQVHSTHSSGMAPSAETRAVSIAPAASRSAEIPQVAAPARVVLPQLTPRQHLPIDPPPPARSREAKGPVIRIGAVEVHIVAPIAPPSPAVRQSVAAAKAAPLSRELISSLGLRQG